MVDSDNNYDILKLMDVTTILKCRVYGRFSIGKLFNPLKPYRVQKKTR